MGMKERAVAALRAAGTPAKVMLKVLAGYARAARAL
jgi:hypothetical protein